MNRTNRFEFIVGLFMLAGIAAAVVLCLNVAGLSFAGNSDNGFDVTADFDDIGGLKEMSPVKIGGVRVGRVSSIIINPQTLSPRVTLHISGQYRGKLSAETSASILTQGILGEQYIDLTPGFDPKSLTEEECEAIGCDPNEKYIDESHVIKATKSAMILEKLIEHFVYNMRAK